MIKFNLNGYKSQHPKMITIPIRNNLIAMNSVPAVPVVPVSATVPATAVPAARVRKPRAKMPAQTSSDSTNVQVPKVQIEEVFNSNSVVVHLIGKSLITIVDLTQYINVQNLYCCDNLLTSLLLIKNTKLINLYINNNYIEELNIENNLSLTTLVCHNNLLTSLNMSLNLNIQYISCYNNLITQENADKIAYDILQNERKEKNKKGGQLVIINQHNNRKIEITNNLLTLRNSGWNIR
jgi:hypothetical protein